MWSILQENSSSLQVLVSLLSAAVWIFYLHVFVSSYRRQTRSSLLISREGEHALKGRCVISNMGSEPAFLMDVLAEFETEGSRFTASVVDRQELWERDDDPGHDIAAKGPIASGGHVDIGSFKDIITRAQEAFESEDFTADVLRVRLIVIAATSQARELVAACRSFEFVFDTNGDVIHLRPLQIVAEQVRSRRKRKKLSRLLEQIQRDEAMNAPVTDDLVGDRSFLGSVDGMR